MRLSIVCLLLLLLFYHKGLSCNCQSPLLEQEIAATQTIMLARVISTEQITIRPDRESVHYLYSTRLEVIKRYKGSRSETIEVLSRITGCAYPFEVDSVYILFASRHPKYYKQFTTPCQRTEKASLSASLISKLDKVENQIYQIGQLSSEELYGKIWCNEVFDRVETTPSHKMDFEETQAFVKQNLKPCEIVYEPKNKRDSLIMQSPSFEAVINRFTVIYEVDTAGQICNPKIGNDWNSIPLKDDAMACKKHAIELVRKLPPLNPAEIRQVKVYTTDKFLVDFSLVAEK
ncbi:MAG: hypothetical protein KI791_22240 [Cyclobacteriaceae bacterium]|nr:hypothetical protein [Cyclobacteriaceae bacterium SS2]